jgi:hypothetical protein
MFAKIEQYIQRSKKERQLHLILSEPCIEIGDVSKDFRGMYWGTYKENNQDAENNGRVPISEMWKLVKNRHMPSLDEARKGGLKAKELKVGIHKPKAL